MSEPAWKKDREPLHLTAEQIKLRQSMQPGPEYSRKFADALIENLNRNVREAHPDLPTLSGKPSDPKDPILQQSLRLMDEGIERCNRERFPGGTLRPAQAVAQSLPPSTPTDEQTLEDLIVRAAELADENQLALEARIRALRSAPSAPPDDSTEE